MGVSRGDFQLTHFDNIFSCLNQLEDVKKSLVIFHASKQSSTSHLVLVHRLIPRSISHVNMRVGWVSVSKKELEFREWHTAEANIVCGKFPNFHDERCLITNMKQSTTISDLFQPLHCTRWKICNFTPYKCVISIQHTLLLVMMTALQILPSA